MRIPIRFAALLALFVSLSFGATNKPNILFIMADDLGINDLACYGRKDHRTPNLDKLAAQGTRFTSAYCAQSICSPSRAALMTGKHPARLHITTYLPGRADCAAQKLLHPQMRQALPLEERTIAERLKDAGYATGYIGKWHLGGKGFSPTEQGFDFYHAGQANTKPSEAEGGKGEYDLTERTIEFIERNKEKPFFALLSHNTPHINYTARADLIEANKGALEPVYAAVIEEMDRSVGKLLRRLEELGVTENTIVIFTSDNGGLHVPEGQHKAVTHNTPFRAGKGFVYEGGLRIPLIVRWPGKIPAGRVANTPIVNTEWPPTLIALTGTQERERVAVNTAIEGRDVSSVLLGGGDSAEGRAFVWHFPHYNNQGGKPAGAVRQGDWKLIQLYEDDRLELYNLAEDPSEKNNLIGKELERAQKLQVALLGATESMKVQRNAPNPNFDAAQHRALYVDYDVSRFNLGTADDAERTRVLEWRRGMNAALRK